MNASGALEVLAHGDHGTGGLWQTDGPALAGTVLVLAVAVTFLVAARRPSRLGRRWPPLQTFAYLAGLAVLAVTLFSGLDDDVLPVHVGQHLVLMMVVAPLLVLGGPLRLLLRSMPRRGRMELVGILQDPAVRAMTAGRWTAVMLAADYYGSMAVYLLTPLYRWSTEHLWLHVAAHVYFLACGVLFWMPLLGQDATGWRPTTRTKLIMTAVGVPLSVLLGLVMIARQTGIAPHDLDETTAAGWVLLLGGSVLSVVGVVVVTVRRLGGRPHRENLEVSWPVAS